jgi:hypothetical protein
MQRLILLTRTDCSLCERFVVQLRAALARMTEAPSLEILDIDRDATSDIRMTYSAAVPVMFASEISADRELMRYHFEHAKLVKSKE